MNKKHFQNTRNLLLALVVAIGLLWPVSQTAALTQKAKPVPQAEDLQEIPTNHIIIKYKNTSSAFLAPAQTDEMERLSAAAGVNLQYLRAMSGDAHVLQLPERLSLEQARTISRQLMSLPEIEYAEPDQILRHTLTPNDVQYVNQWHYSGTWGINAPAAWDITTGSSSIVVAVVDTGITNHADLSGRTVPGYDFIGDTLVANDGGGRDSDPSDPGDWISSAEDASGYFAGCGTSDSSWHGTHVSGTIGAASNNGIGVAGINWNSKILPVRVLGKCGGYTSDIVDGMSWAAGLPVAGIPANPNPAKVLNVSLGGFGSCDATWQTAISNITAAGAVVVAAAGNSAFDASYFVPANCSGVITVAATNSSGSLAYYSNYGSTVEVSAPGGEQYYDNDPGGVLSTLNTGTTTPVSDTYIYYQGTSMAAPHVSGVVSLMFSRNPYMTPSQVLQILQSTAKAFPGGGSCTTSICGSGIVNAGAAVGAVTPQTFSDVSTSYWAYSYIEKLYNAGITGGCSNNPLMYCPASSVTRAQMAVFLLKGIHGSSYSPPPATGGVFGDVANSHWAAAWIERLFAEGITGGCGTGIYCPEDTVTRAQMAVFLLKAKYGTSYAPPPATGDFSDVATDHWAAAWIEQLAAEGITSGCGTGIYCPESPVTRDQMAVFLVKTFNLP
ncbi:MAG: S8 family serine peptidase [Chloroflexi bacterium]|nr:S8 family serine peptidase [Chloroflexota bacterium]